MNEFITEEGMMNGKVYQLAWNETFNKASARAAAKIALALLLLFVVFTLTLGFASMTWV